MRLQLIDGASVFLLATGTALLQSSTATVVMTIGFVSAGLIAFAAEIERARM